MCFNRECNEIMAKGTQPKTSRNEQLIVDYQRRNADGTVKFTVQELEKKYDLSATYIYRILKANNIPLDRPRDNISKYNKEKKSK